LSRSPLERAVDALLKEEVKKLNIHLPRGRKSLEQLLKEDEPSIEALDGTRIIMRREELERLAEIIPEKFHKKVELPFVIFRRMELGKSTYTVSGSKFQEFIVKRILGLTDLTFNQFEAEKEPLYLYKPQVSELIRKFHSLIVIGFGIPEELKF
jgi:uncharacterized protein (UPF0216 family)